MQLPRLRIAHQLALLLSAGVVLAVLAIGALSVWNLHSGFIDYLRLRDDEEFGRFVQLVERHAAADPGMRWLTGERNAMRELVDEFNGRPPRLRRPPPPFEDGRPPGPEMEDRPPPPPLFRPTSSVGERVVLRDLGGRWLAGRPQPPAARRTVRAIRVDGKPVALAELAAEPEPEGVDARFLQRQYTGLAGAALVTVVISLLVGWRMAARWSRPLRELQVATRRIAQGEESVQIRVRPDGTRSWSGAVEIDQLIADVNGMAVALGALAEARRTWIAQISHELRTPLAVLRGELESIEDGARQPSAQVIRSLGEEVAQLTRLVDDLHTLSVADLGQMPCRFVPGDADEVLRRVAGKFDGRARQLGLTFAIAQAPRAIPVRWDFGRIEQLLSNLLENSLRYTAGPGRVVLSWTTDAGILHLLAEDTAPGVAAADLAKLFDPLFRADAARTRTGQHGSGLGLSIVRAIARAHRGSVQAAASALGGIALQVDLPVDPERLERRKSRP